MSRLISEMMYDVAIQCKSNTSYSTVWIRITDFEWQQNLQQHGTLRGFSATTEHVKLTIINCHLTSASGSGSLNFSTKINTALVRRFIPLELLQLLENWLSDSLACVKWGNSWSQTFKISSGVRQGSVLSPFLFAVYVDDIAKLQNNMIDTYIIIIVRWWCSVIGTVGHSTPETVIGLWARIRVSNWYGY